jgi:signal transduction histidine kinase
MSRSAEADSIAQANGRPGPARLGVAVLAIAYLAVLVTLALLLRDDARLRGDFVVYVSGEDRWTLYRTETEYLMLLNSLAPPPGQGSVPLAAVRLSLDVFYARNETLKASRAALGHSGALPEYAAAVRAIDQAIAEADAILADEPGPLLSDAALLALRRDFAPLAETIAELRQRSLTLTSAERTALREAGLRSESNIRLTVGGLVALTFVVTLALLWVARREHRAAQRWQELNRSLRVARARLSQSAETAETANRAKSEFLANMSHELRTPLNAIIGFSELMETETFGPIGNEHYRGYAADIRRSGHHLLAIVGDILDLERIEAGRRQLEETRCEIAALFGEAVKLVEPQAAAKGLSLRWSAETGLPAFRADARALIQTLVNLLGNAVKFTPAGGSVTLAAARTGNGDIEFSVNDSGVGMDEADIPRALAPFGQIKSSVYLRQQEGTGLGLPIAKSLVELHGGSLALASAPGQGTTVTIRLPAKRVLD